MSLFDRYRPSTRKAIREDGLRNIEWERSRAEERLRRSEADALAERLGYRIEKYRGEDKYLIRDLHTQVRVAHGLTWRGIESFLKREANDR